MKLIILGPPGAGKGTQAEGIVNRYGVVHISTGDIFRANLKASTPLGVRAKEYMDKGLLVPDELTVEMVKDRLAQPDCEAGYMLDGFPRTIAQAEALDKMLAESGDSLDCALAIIVDYSALTERIVGRRICRKCAATYHVKFNPPAKEGVCDKCGGELYQRDDDKEETVVTRLAEYDEKTQPLIEYYRGKGILATVDGFGAIEAVGAEIAAVLDNFR